MDSNNHFCAVLGERSTLEEVGGKAFNLWRAKQHGAQIPATFVVHRSALKLSLQELGLYQDVASYLELLEDDGFKQLESRYDALCLRFDSVGLPTRVAKEFDLLASEFFEQAPAGLAVRSSAIQEDSEGASFAGVFESWIGIRSHRELVSCLLQCWMSSWSPKALRYFRRMGVRPSVDGMAVMVQPVLDASVSGGLYTANPDSGNPMEMVITATPGLAVELMAAGGLGDRFIVDWSTGRTVSRTLAEKAVRLEPGLHGVERRCVPNTEARRASLNEEQIRDLHFEVRRLDERFAIRLDIEFVFDSDGLKIVQVRPMTALPEYFPHRLSAADQAREWHRMEYVIPFREDGAKGMLTPLFANLSDAELWQRYQPDDITLGVYCQETRDFLGYRYQGAGKMPIFTDFLEDTDSMEDWLERNETSYRTRWDLCREELGSIVVIAKTALSGQRSLSRLIPAWLKVRHQLWDLNAFGWSGPQYLGWMCEMVLSDFIKQRGLDCEAATLLGGAESHTFEVTCGLQSLGRSVHNPILKERLGAIPLEKMMDTLLGDDAASGFVQALEDWAWAVGRRPPSWYRRPSFWSHGTDHVETFHAIRCAMKGDSQDVRESRMTAEKRALAAEKVVREALKEDDGGECVRFEKILKWTRYWGQALNDRHCLGIGLQWEYELIWEMGVLLVRAGAIAKAGDILALTEDDLIELQRGKRPDELKDRFDERVSDYQVRLRLQAPEKRGRSEVGTASEPLGAGSVSVEATLASSSTKEWKGEGIGASSVVGTARLVQDLKDPKLLEQLSRSDILVLPGANDFHYADWHSLLTLIGGVVALAQPSHHLAQVARECGVPIVGKIGTSVTFEEGERVRVDAALGVVQFVD